MSDDRWLAWAAGLFEGEGCIHLRTSCRPKGFPRPGLILSTTDYDVICRFAEVVGVGYIKGPIERPNRKPFWTWRLASGSEVRRVLLSFREFLGSRRSRKVDEALTALDNLPGKMQGGRHYNARLSVEDVQAIRSATVAQHVLAKQFGVSQSQISDIKLRRCWKHVA